MPSIGPRDRSRRSAGPGSVEGILWAAAPTGSPPESFYGLLARETLGMSTKLAADPFTSGVTSKSTSMPNVQRASELVRIGEAAWPRRCSSTRRRSGRQPSTTR